MELGNKILKLRKKKGLSQEELGEKIDVTRQTISNWELGTTSPNPEQLKKLSKELSVSIDELLDNDIQNVLVEKVSNTEELAGLILKIIKVLFAIIIICIVGFVLLILVNIVYKTIKYSKDNGRELETSIHCKLYGEEHTFGIKYYELTGQPIELGGDSYFSDILDLDKYNDAHQIFNVINDYVKKNGGTCEMIESYELNDFIDFYVKEGSLNKTGGTFILKTDTDYEISFGASFWLEKYDYKTNNYEVLSQKENNCAFNMIAYHLVKGKPFELKQGWSCMYGELDKGLYRIVKHVTFNSDRPISDDDLFYIWSEFEIE